MRKTIAIPSAALAGFLLVAPPASAAPGTGDTVVSGQERQGKRADRGRVDYPIQTRYVKRYKLGPKALKEIAKAKKWAEGSKPRSVRQCESGGNYGIHTGNGYYGAYQFAAGTWRGVGGGRYAPYAHMAPKFAQDHMAYRLWKRAGWGPWGCA